MCARRLSKTKGSITPFGKLAEKDLTKDAAIQIRFNSRAIALTSFDFSRTWEVLEKSKAPRYCGSEIGLSHSELILRRFLELRQKATPGCGFCEGVSGMTGGTFPLDCFCLGLDVGLWVEMVMALCLLESSERLLANN